MAWPTEQGNAGTLLLSGLIGFWLVMRSANRDSSGRTLIDHILGQSGGANQVLPAASYTPAGATAASGSVAALKPTLDSIAQSMGWDANQVAAWQGVITRESGGSLTARNPSSGAYGIAQFINGPGEYARYGGNATTVPGQLTAMANYIRQRYGTPAAALAHENAAGWY